MHFYDSATADYFHKLQEYAKQDVILRKFPLTELALVNPDEIQYCAGFDVCSAETALDSLKNFYQANPMPFNELNGQTMQDLDMISKTIQEVLEPFNGKDGRFLFDSEDTCERGLLTLLEEELTRKYIIPGKLCRQAALGMGFAGENRRLFSREIPALGNRIAEAIKETIVCSVFGRAADLKRRNLGVPYRIVSAAGSFWLYPASSDNSYRIKIELPEDYKFLYGNLIGNSVVCLPNIDSSKLNHIRFEDFWKSKLKSVGELEDKSISLLALPNNAFDRDCIWMKPFRHYAWMETSTESEITAWYEEQENGKMQRRLAVGRMVDNDPYDWKSEESCRGYQDIGSYITKQENATSLLQLYSIAAAFQQAFALNEAMLFEDRPLRLFVYDNGTGLAIDALCIVLSGIRKPSQGITVVRYRVTGNENPSGQCLSSLKLEEYSESNYRDVYDLAYLPSDGSIPCSFYFGIEKRTRAIVSARVDLNTSDRKGMEQHSFLLRVREYSRKSVESQKYRILEKLRKGCLLYIQGKLMQEDLDDSNPLAVFDSDWLVSLARPDSVTPLQDENGFIACDGTEKGRSQMMNKNLPEAFKDIAVFKFGFFIRLSDNKRITNDKKPPTAFLRISDKDTQNRNDPNAFYWKKDFYSVFVSFLPVEDCGWPYWFYLEYIQPNTMILYPLENKKFIFESGGRGDYRVTDANTLDKGYIWRFMSYFPPEDESENGSKDKSESYDNVICNEIAITKVVRGSGEGIDTLPRYDEGMQNLFRIHQGISVHILNNKDIFEKDEAKIWHNYADLNCRIYYIYRFLLKYAFEYARIYRRLFNNAPELIRKARSEKKLNVISFGCGIGIDYRALRMALRELGLEDTKVCYTGVDYYNWEEGCDLLKNSPLYDTSIMIGFDEKDRVESRYIVGNVTTPGESGDAFSLVRYWRNRGEQKHYDIVFFPASFRDIFKFKDDSTVSEFWEEFNQVNSCPYYISIPNPVVKDTDKDNLSGHDNFELDRFNRINNKQALKVEKVEERNGECNECVECFKEYQKLFHMYYPRMASYIYKYILAEDGNIDQEIKRKNAREMKNAIVVPYPNYNHQEWTSNIYRACRTESKENK